MNKNLLKTGVQSFIRNFSEADILAVALKTSPFEGVKPGELATQLKAREKCRTKLPRWYETEKIYYPVPASVEQASSEKTAAYKAGLVNGKMLVDITGGMGVDSFYFAKHVQQVFHCETDPELSEITRHNFNILGIKNISCLNIDGLEYLSSKVQQCDWIYADPSRRDTGGRKVRLKDYIPDIPSKLPLLFQKTDHVLLKTSPLLDISAGIAELKNVREVHIVELDREVRELLWILKKGYVKEPFIHVVQLNEIPQVLLSFRPSEEKKATLQIGEIGEYLYEPCPALLKSGAFKLIADRFGLKKISTNAHLYTHKETIQFPGRSFRVLQKAAFNRRSMGKLKIEKANISARDFPLNAQQLHRKYKIRSGGDVFLVFTTDRSGQRVVLQCEKV